MEDRQNNHIKPKQMSYKYWLVGMIAQGMSDSDLQADDYADVVVDRVEAVLDRLREDKVKRRNSDDYYE